MKRKLQSIKLELSHAYPEHELDARARAQLLKEGLIYPEEEDSKQEGDEEATRKAQITVEDYTEEEIEEDINMVDWDFAYNEILKIEDRKKDKATKEAEEKLNY